MHSLNKYSTNIHQIELRTAHVMDILYYRTVGFVRSSPKTVMIMIINLESRNCPSAQSLVTLNLIIFRTGGGMFNGNVYV